MSKQTSSLKPQTATANLTPAPSGILQRKCACGSHTVAGGECGSCRKEKPTVNLQRSATNVESVNEVPPIVYDVLHSSGQPLDTATRAFMESRFGHNFSQVRVHTDTKAAESARTVSALAYTIGRDVVFDTGQYAPGTSAGRLLLAHELSHVVQQGRGYGQRIDLRAFVPAQRDFSSTVPANTSINMGMPSDTAEREADQIADQVVHQTSADIPSAKAHDSAPILRAQGGQGQTPSQEQIREMRLRQLATRPGLALRQWRTLNQVDREQIQWNMMSTYGQPFVIEFLKYAKGLKQPRPGPAGVIKGPEYTPKRLFDRGYRHAYGELWVHPSGEELTVLSPAKTEDTETEDDQAKIEKCEKMCEEIDDQDECMDCCEKKIPEQDSRCRTNCKHKCAMKI